MLMCFVTMFSLLWPGVAIGEAPRIDLVSISPLTVAIDGGALITARVDALPADAENITCNLAWRGDSWKFTVQPFAGSMVSATKVSCAPMPALPAEGPVDFFVEAGGTSSNKQRLWTFSPFSASPGMTPYLGGPEHGELLVRINDSDLERPGQYELSAVSSDGSVTFLDRATVRGGDIKRAVPVSFQDLPAIKNASLLNVEVNVTLHHPTLGALERKVRLLWVPTTQAGATAIDHRSRGIVVDGRAFFPVSWMTTADSFGTDFMMTAMRDMARRGANSIMIYDLGAAEGMALRGAEQIYPLMDTAQAVGLKVQLDVMRMIRPIAKTGGTAEQWAQLQTVVNLSKRHPALLGYYVADDGAGVYLPTVYTKLREWDPYHIVTMAIAGIGSAWQDHYLAGVDVMMPENYPGSAAPRSWDTMRIMNFYPYDWSAAMTCGMAWAAPVTSEAMFRMELYNSIIAGATGDIWFAHRTLPGEWNEPGPLLDVSGVLGREMLELVPSLVPTEVAEADADTSPQPRLVAISGVTQSGRPARVHAAARREGSGCVHLLLANNVNEPVRASVRFAEGTAGIFVPGHVDQAFGLVPFEKVLPSMARRVEVVNGSISEWLPSWGTQVFRFNGTSSCATQAPQLAEGNLVSNPSFEESVSYTAAPDSWSCSVSVALDRACFADASDAKSGRRSGRFSSGSDVGSFRILVPLTKHAEATVQEGEQYRFAAWVRGDIAGQTVSLQSLGAACQPAVVTRGWRNPADEVLITSVVAGVQWTQLQATVTTPTSLALAVSKPGVLWVDDVSLSLDSPSAAFV